jgi:hypothetical protein
LQRAQPSRVQAGFQHQQRAGAEEQAAGAHRRVLDRDLVGGVEGAELAGEFVEIGAEEMRAEVRGGELHGVGELDELAREGEFGGVSNAWRRPRPRAGFEAELAEDAVDARDGVEQVGGGVAVEGDHLVPREHVVAGAVLREVGVLHGATPTTAAMAARSASGSSALLPSTSAVGALGGLGQQVLEPDVVAAARLERLVVFAQHRAEIDVLELRQRRPVCSNHFFAVRKSCSKWSLWRLSTT